MTEQAQDPGSVESAGTPPAGGESGGSAPLGGQPAAASMVVDERPAARAQGLSQRPEVLIAATFAGGLVLAAILKRLAR